MCTSTRLIGLMMAAALLVGGAVAEELPMPGPGEPETPSGLWLPTFERGAVPPGAHPATDRSILPAPGAGDEAIESLEGYDQLRPKPYDLWDQQPARIESSGTWLRRGLWYLEADAAVLNRQWSPNDLLMSQEVTATGLITNRLLVLKAAQPGEDTSVRITLGRFLFRDLRNRDHTVEFTAFGGGDWSQDAVVTSTQPNRLFVFPGLSGGNRSFDQSTLQSVSYGSHYSSFELNYRVKQRMGRDQMVMEPNGCWHRTGNSGMSRNFLVGLRLLELRDIMDWRAQDIVNDGDDGEYVIRTDNDLFGFQIGAGLDYETPRWSIGVSGKGGVYVNDVLGRSTLDFTADNTDDFDIRTSVDELSFIGQTQILGKWHLAPNFSLRAGCELLYITAAALAPHQANFIPVYSQLATTGDPFYFGATFGFEGYW